MELVRSRIAVALVSALTALALAFALAPQARAMALYNNSTYFQGGVNVRFICGFACGWFDKGIGGGETAAYPGKGGSFSINQGGCIISSAHPNIENHGYAMLVGTILSFAKTDIAWHMWHNDESVVSGSPFLVACFPPEPLAEASLARPAGSLGQIERQFRAWDTDRSGDLSRGELRAGVRRDFGQIDLDHNGVIDVRDIRLDLKGQSRGARGRAGDTVLPFDLDHSGAVLPGEYWRYVRRTFVGPMERKHDERISPAEMKAFYASRLG